MILVAVRCGQDGCRRLMAEVSRDPDDPRRLQVRQAGRSPRVPRDGQGPTRWRRADRVTVVDDPRTHDHPRGRPVPVTCDKHPTSRPFLFPALLRDALGTAEVHGRTEDVDLWSLLGHREHGA